MKRTIGLILIFIIEIAFGIVYYQSDVWNSIVSAIPFFANIPEWIRFVLNPLKNWIQIPWFQGLPNLAKNIIIVVALNIIFTIAYLLIFGIIAAISKSIRKKKIREHTKKTFTLSDEEKAKFEWKLYEKKFPIRRLISLIIPIAITLLCIVIRFDKELCAAEDKFNAGYFDFYQGIKGYFGQFGIWVSSVFAKYIHLNNRISNSLGVTFVEWIIIAVLFILFCTIWLLLFSIFAKPYRRHRAKVRARRAKEKYITRMENLEYKAWKKAKKEASISNKGKEFYQEELPEDNAEINPLFIPDNPVKQDNSELKKNVSQEEKEYIDDIATGVTDLGIIEEDQSELTEPITIRETHFVGDEEVDIVLEEEPIIETIEEEEEYYNKDDLIEEGFEKYQPDNVSSLDVEDKIKKYNIDVIDESSEDIQHFEEKVPVIQDYEDKDILYTVNKEYLEALKKNPALHSDNENPKLKEKEVEKDIKVVLVPPKEEIKDESKIIKEKKNEEIKVEKKSSLVETIVDARQNEEKKEIKPVAALKKEENPIEEIKETAKPKNVQVLYVKTNPNRKPIKPLAVSEDRSRVVEYILKTNKVNVDNSMITPKEDSQIKKEEPLVNPKEIKKAKPLHKVNAKKKNIKPLQPLSPKKKEK